jgi:hypothetical protein
MSVCNREGMKLSLKSRQWLNRYGVFWCNDENFET